jgi:hypothetical protein
LSAMNATFAPGTKVIKDPPPSLVDGQAIKEKGES